MPDPAGRLLLGVDGGNTKSVALLARADGTVVGAGRSLGSADIHSAPLEAALELLVAAIDDAFAEAGVRAAVVAGRPELAASAFSLAGADWPEDVTLLAERLGERWPDCLIVNDAIGALRAAVPSGPGVVVVCGTGAATGARGADGQTWHSSFWQGPHGAHDLGALALEAVYRSELRIDPPTALTAPILALLGQPDVESILHLANRRDEQPWREQARLAPILLDTAEAGDPAAVAIAVEHGRALGRYALAAARRVGIADGSFPLALAGGVLRHGGRLLPDALVGAVHEGAPGAVPVRPTLEPAAGALLLAFDRAGIAVSDDVQERLRASLPPHGLFDTHAARMPA